MKSHYRGHKMAVWLNLIPQLHQPGDDDVSMRHHHFHERGEHYYSGAVRAESFTRLPPPIIVPTAAAAVRGATGSMLTSPGTTECLPNATTSPNLDDNLDLGADDDDSSLLQRLANRHYYSYTAALGVTVGVGCLLLILNMLIFAGIYYQRDRRHRPRSRSTTRDNSSEAIALSTRPSTTLSDDGGSQSAPVETSIKVHEPPPCYTTVASNKEQQQQPPQGGSTSSTLPRVPPVPPVRTSSVQTPMQSQTLPSVKKRVQIQEIAV